MSELNIDSILTGIIVLLVIVIVYRWHQSGSCGSGIKLHCGCNAGRCVCRGVSWSSVPRCPGGSACACGCARGQCSCPSTCMCQKKAAQRSLQNGARSTLGGAGGAGVAEGMNDVGLQGIHPKADPSVAAYDLTLAERERIASSSGVTKVEQQYADGDYSQAVQAMALEADVGISHKRYCDSLSFAGMPTGSSSCTLLAEPDGRSVGVSSYVGLTRRKWCRARNLAIPAASARQTTSVDVIEPCGIGPDSLV